MDSLLFLAGTSFVVALSGAMMPGPMLTATISEVMKRGVMAGPLIVVGHGLLEIALVAAVVGGLAGFISSTSVVAVMGVVGGAVLAVMGVHMALTSARAVNKAMHEQADETLAVRGPVVTGVITSLSNPYWTLWWATIGLNYLSRSLQRGAAGISSFYIGHIAADFAWFGLVAVAVNGGRRICPPAVYRVVIVLCGVALAGLGGWFAWDGINALC
ncbi:MAG: LysE family translocator [Verrucomicrobia bacterium]|nr:LysE family translocator [Verrucomicrobiota bacterium]